MRSLFGGSPSDYAMEPVGLQLILRPGAVGSAWDSPTGGTQYTDLTDLTLNPITQITAADDGSVAFYGPDGVTSLYLDFGFGRRYTMAAIDTGGLLADFVAQAGEPGGWVQLDENGHVDPTVLPAGEPWTSTKGLVVTAPAGATSYVIWQAPQACTVVGVRGYRVGGTGATINATRNGLDLLAADLSLSTAGTWLSGPSVQNATVAIGDSFAVAVRSVSGTPTAVTVQVDVQEA